MFSRIRTFLFLLFWSLICVLVPRIIFAQDLPISGDSANDWATALRKLSAEVIVYLVLFYVLHYQRQSIIALTKVVSRLNKEVALFRELFESRPCISHGLRRASDRQTGAHALLIENEPPTDPLLEIR